MSALLHVHYDRATDVLQVMACKPYSTLNFMIDWNFTLRLDPKSKEVVGLTVVCYEDLFPGPQTPKERRFIAGTLLTVFRQLWWEGAFDCPPQKRAA